MHPKLRATLRRYIICVSILFVLLYIIQEPWNTLARWNNERFCYQEFNLDTVSTHNASTPAIRPKPLRFDVSAIPSGQTPKCVGLIEHQAVTVSKLENLDIWNSEKSQITKNYRMSDGSYRPTNCRPQHRVAIIIPLRGREGYLHHLLSHMHPIWQRQGIAYTVFVVTQIPGLQFNKAKVMNAGFKEARKHGRYDCFVFHDVDALLEDDRCLYWCDQENPRHLCAHADVFNYREVWYYSSCRLPQNLFTMTRLFGGVTMFTPEQFIRINGFSNYYWGWGGEDDDMYNRLQSKGYKVINPYGRQCSYTLLQHPHETLNAPTRAKESLVYHSVSRQDKEGLHNVRYKVMSYQYKPLFINITIDVGRPSKRMQEFIDNSKRLWFFNQCIVRMPWNL